MFDRPQTRSPQNMGMMRLLNVKKIEASDLLKFNFGLLQLQIRQFLPTLNSVIYPFVYIIPRKVLFCNTGNKSLYNYRA
jgi:hypothetical protein